VHHGRGVLHLPCIKSATSWSKGRSARARPRLARRLRGAAVADLSARAAAGEPVPVALLPGHAALRAADAAFFLFQRSACSSRWRSSTSSRGRSIGDFLLDKDPLFARITLSGTSSRSTRRCTTRCARAPAPDLVSTCRRSPRCSPSACAAAPRLRARHQRGIPALLAESYARFFHHYDAAPVLIVNSENLNFVERDADFELLVSRLRAMKSRREFFNLG
jgi:hypothetical protein